MFVCIQDRHGLANGDSQLDASQDYDLIGAQENETHTVLRFRRKLVTCDDKDLNITVSDSILLNPIATHHSTTTTTTTTTLTSIKKLLFISRNLFFCTHPHRHQHRG